MLLLWSAPSYLAFLGYKLMGWWAPCAGLCMRSAMQAVSFRACSSSRQRGGYVQILAMSGLMSLLMFYATFSMGRSWA